MPEESKLVELELIHSDSERVEHLMLCALDAGSFSHRSPRLSSIGENNGPPS